METPNPIRDEMLRNANELGFMAESNKNRYWADQYYLRWRAVHNNPRMESATIAELEASFSLNNAAVLAAKDLEDKLTAEMEELRSDPSSSESD